MSRNSSLKIIKQTIEKAQNPLMFFDTDTDGSMSFYQIKYLNNNLKGVPLPKDAKKQKDLKEIITQNHDLILFFDTPMISEELLKQLQDKQIIWVDHHENNDVSILDNYQVLYFNPLEDDSNDNRPASYWAYKIVDKVEIVSYAVVGSVADFFLLEPIQQWYEYDKKSFKQMINLSDKQIDDLLNVKNDPEKTREWIQYLSFKTRIGELKLFFDVFYKLDDEIVLECFSKISSYSLQELLEESAAGKNEPFSNFSQIRKTLNSHLKKCHSKNKTKSVVYYHHNDDMSLNRQIAEQYLFQHSDKEIILVTHQKPGKTNISCSIRSKTIPIREILLNELNKINGKGGGHDLSAGAFLEEKYFEQFKSQFLQKCEEELSKKLEL